MHVTNPSYPILLSQVPVLVGQGSRLVGSVIRAANDTAPLIIQVKDYIYMSNKTNWNVVSSAMLAVLVVRDSTKLWNIASYMRHSSYIHPFIRPV